MVGKLAASILHVLRTLAAPQRKARDREEDSLSKTETNPIMNSSGHILDHMPTQEFG